MKSFPYFMCPGQLLIQCATGWASEESTGGLQGVFLAKSVFVILRLPSCTHQDALCRWLFKQQTTVCPHYDLGLGSDKQHW